MSAPVIRRLFLSGLLLGLLAVAIFLSLPFLASTSIIRGRITAELSNWTGYRVELTAAPEISLFPNVEVKLSGVQLTPWGKPEATVARAEEVRVALSALDAVSGRIRFTRIDIIRPVIKLPDAGSLPEAPSSGRFVTAIRVAESAISADGEAPDLSFVPDEPLGTVSLVDGRAVYTQDGQELPVVSSVNATISWPRLAAGLSAMGSAIWNGEQADLRLSAQQPLLLLAGGQSKLTVELASKPLALSYDGIVTRRPALFVNGTASLSTPSLSRAMEWSRVTASQGLLPGRVAVSGRLSGGPERMKLEEAELAFGDSTGSGVLEFGLPGPVPVVAGTLHFPAMDLATILNAFPDVLPGDPAGSALADVPANRINLDLRLSADNASFGAVALNEVAATAQVKDDLSVFDISDARAFGGSVQAGLRINRGKDGRTSELRVLATEVDGRLIGETIPLASGVPDAITTFSLILKGPGASWRDLIENSTGSLSAQMAAGVIPEVDLDRFVDRLRTSGFFRLSEARGRPLEFQTAEVELAIETGVARIQKATLTTPVRQVKLVGLIPLAGRSLAIAGTVTPLGENRAGATPLSFFAGGSWNAPLISPVLAPAAAPQ